MGLLLIRCSGQGPHLAMTGEPRGFSRVAAGFSSYDGDFRLPLRFGRDWFPCAGAVLSLGQTHRGRPQTTSTRLYAGGEAGIKIAGRNINNLRYADDTTLMAESEEELKSLLMKVKVESEKAGLQGPLMLLRDALSQRSSCHSPAPGHVASPTTPITDQWLPLHSGNHLLWSHACALSRFSRV